MRVVYPSDIDEEFAFARKAGEHFAADPEHVSFTTEAIAPGCMLGLRWGAGRDCVLVVKLDEFHKPTIYAQIVPPATTTTGSTT